MKCQKCVKYSHKANGDIFKHTLTQKYLVCSHITTEKEAGNEGIKNNYNAQYVDYMGFLFRDQIW